MSDLTRAICIAAQAHDGQLDKGGEPYVLHVLRVMLHVHTLEERVVAVLHDVVEDTDWTVERLREEGFPEAVLAAVDALSRREGEDYFDFVRRASGAGPIARAVKRADLNDNLELSRIPAPIERDTKRIERYRRALAMLDAEETAVPPAGSPE